MGLWLGFYLLFGAKLTSRLNLGKWFHPGEINWVKCLGWHPMISYYG